MLELLGLQTPSAATRWLPPLISQALPRPLRRRRFIYHDWIEKKYARATLEPVWQTKVDVSDRERLLQYCSRRVGPLAPKSMSRGLAGLG